MIKNEPFKAFWEEGYRNFDVSTMGLPSFEVSEISAALPKAAKVLDLGCGEGRNSLFLASLGHHVTAVERSSSGMEKLLQMASRYNVSIKGIVSDIRDFVWEESYDLIMAHGVLYYLPRSDWQVLLRQAKKWTLPGGYNIFTLFIYDNEYPVTDEISLAGYLGSFEVGEIGEFYKDWDQLSYEHYVKWDSHPGIPIHYHPIEKLIVSKSSSTSGFFKIQRPPIMETSVSYGDFMKLDLGATIHELIEYFGIPCSIAQQKSDGISYGPYVEQMVLPPMEQGFDLSLWYYGKYVFYITRERVVGKAMFRIPKK